jgi:hypothetical protein
MTSLAQSAQRLGSTLLFATHRKNLLDRAEGFSTQKLDTSEDHLLDLVAEAIAIIATGKVH